MAFGPIMSMRIGELQIELAPLNKEVMREFVQPGMQQYSVLKFLMRGAQVEEDEYEWYEHVRKAQDSVVWGIWVVAEDSRTVIGTTAIHDITRTHIHQATSGSMMFRKEYWGRGIAKHIHMARTWYAFQHMGIDRVISAVIQGNAASLKALQRSGYDLVYVERNTHFVDGRLHHQDNLECLNPSEISWLKWWQDEEPTDLMVAARERTRTAMAWAKQHVELP